MSTEEEFEDQSFQENTESGGNIWETIYKYINQWPWFLWLRVTFM
jgi:hypothetical protein